MNEDQWYILAGVLIWSLVLLLAAVILLRALRQRLVQRRIIRLEEDEARRIATHFASRHDPSSGSMDSIPTSDIRHLRHALHRRQQGWELFPPGNMYRPRDGLNKEEMQRYAPVIVHEEGKGGEEGNQTSSDGMLVCVVCLEDVMYGSRKRVLPCGHAFHARCVQIWLARSVRCPCCMVAVVKRSSAPLLQTIAFEDLNRHGSRLRETGEMSRGRQGRQQGSRFLGLWTFGDREDVARDTDGRMELEPPQMTDLESSGHVVPPPTPELVERGEERGSSQGIEEVLPAATVDIVDQVPSAETIVQIVRPLERSRQIDDMITSAA